MSDLSTIDFATLTPAQFEEILPDLFAGGGKVSEDPRLQTFLAANPSASELVHDLETIAETAKALFEPTHEPSDDLWNKIQGRMNSDSDDTEDSDDSEGIEPLDAREPLEPKDLSGPSSSSDHSK